MNAPRSYLFVPGDRPERFEKALATGNPAACAAEGARYTWENCTRQFLANLVPAFFFRLQAFVFLSTVRLFVVQTISSWLALRRRHSDAAPTFVGR